MGTSAYGAERESMPATLAVMWAYALLTVHTLPVGLGRED